MRLDFELKAVCLLPSDSLSYSVQINVLEKVNTFILYLLAMLVALQIELWPVGLGLTLVVIL